MSTVWEWLRELAHGVQPFAEAWGAPGLAVVAFIDSSFLTLPEASDLLIVLLTVRAPDAWYTFPLAATAGSIAGSYALYLVGLRGGAALLRRRFGEGAVHRSLDWFRRYGAWTLVVPAMMPPPMPFKIFVLASGVAGVPRLAFLLAVLVGRGTRYTGVALLARRYGRSAIAVAQAHLLEVMLVGVGVLLLAGVGWWGWRRTVARGRTPEADEGGGPGRPL
jgi:membrane protein YqaA with SNARE-associated domain